MQASQVQAAASEIKLQKYFRCLLVILHIPILCEQLTNGRPWLNNLQPCLSTWSISETDNIRLMLRKRLLGSYTPNQDSRTSVFNCWFLFTKDINFSNHPWCWVISFLCQSLVHVFCIFENVILRFLITHQLTTNYHIKRLNRKIYLGRDGKDGL